MLKPLLIAAAALFVASACDQPPPVEGEGERPAEGEGDPLPSEGEGDVVAEGEGDIVAEGEGDIVAEGEGDIVAEGEGDVVTGEGEGEPCVDVDQDGACADVDCDDNDRARTPGNVERCSRVDEDCDDDNNDGLDCTFVAHTRDKLYKIDPFARTATFLKDVTLIDNAGLLDIDLNLSGALVAGTRDGIYEIRDNGSLAAVANVAAPTNTNGICITGNGTLFLTNDDDAASAAWRVDGSAIVEVGGFSQGLVSSGDCVVTKEEDVLMSAKDPSNPTDPDVLVLVDSSTGATTDVGSIGFAKVFGLSASFGLLFGVTVDGNVLEIDRNTGTGTNLFIAEDAGQPIRFGGAANGD